jgi:hypothetical protein
MQLKEKYTLLGPIQHGLANRGTPLAIEGHPPIALHVVHLQRCLRHRQHYPQRDGGRPISAVVIGGGARRELAESDTIFHWPRPPIVAFERENWAPKDDLSEQVPIADPNVDGNGEPNGCQERN